MVVLLGVLLGAAYYGWNTIVNPDDDNKADKSDDAKQTTCKHQTVIKKGQQIQSNQVTVNVYNAGNRSGLAGETLNLLVAKGFKRGVADNAPEDITTWGNASVVLAGGAGEPTSRLVHNQFLGLVKYVDGPELARGVDVIVGDNFRGVKPDSQTFVRVNRKVETCVGKEKSTPAGNANGGNG
jgi:hypothetical protein